MSILEGIDPAKMGDRLRVARSTAGLTQEDAAIQLSVARTTLVAIEQGQRRVRPDELRAFAKTLSGGNQRPTSCFGNPSGFCGGSLDALVVMSRAVPLLKMPSDCSIGWRDQWLKLEERLNHSCVFHYPPEKRFTPAI